MRSGKGSFETLVWLILLAVTLISWGMAESTLAAPVTATVVILIGAFKVRLVFIHFMELRRSVQPWRTLFEIWIGMVTAIILFGYWIGRA